MGILPVPPATRRPVQEWIEKWRDRGNGLVQRSRHCQERASCFDRVARLPESPVRDGEASRQLQATPLGFAALSPASQTAARSGALMKKHNALARRRSTGRTTTCDLPGTGAHRL